MCAKENEVTRAPDRTAGARRDGAPRDERENIEASSAGSDPQIETTSKAEYSGLMEHYEEYMSRKGRRRECTGLPAVPNTDPHTYRAQRRAASQRGVTPGWM